MPIQSGGTAASSIDPYTWTTYDKARASTAGDGLGFVLSIADDIYCIDLDGCLIAGGASEAALAIIERTQGTYTEVSPSGQGLHIFLRGKCPRATVLRNQGIEIYESKRFLCMTGDRVGDATEILSLDCDQLFA